MDIIAGDRGGNRTTYINWYMEPADIDRQAIAIKYLKYTKGVLIPMTLLIPDRDRENQDDFIWCVPIERVKWNKWYALSEKFKTAVPKEHGGGVRYMNRMEGGNIKTILVMPTEYQTDDDAVTACAYLRMVEGMTCRVYIVRCTDDPLTGPRLIAKCAGANVNYVEEVEFTDENCPTSKEG